MRVSPPPGNPGVLSRSARLVCPFLHSREWVSRHWGFASIRVRVHGVSRPWGFAPSGVSRPEGSRENGFHLRGIALRARNRHPWPPRRAAAGVVLLERIGETAITRSYPPVAHREGRRTGEKGGEVGKTRSNTMGRRYGRCGPAGGPRVRLLRRFRQQGLDWRDGGETFRNRRQYGGARTSPRGTATGL